MYKCINKKVVLSFFITLLLTSLWFLKDFHLFWIETGTDCTRVTINFLFPMVQEKLEDSLEIVYELPYNAQFEYEVKWLTPSVVEMKFKEQSLIKGQSVQLHIRHLPSHLPFISKSVNIPLTFKTSVEILEPLEGTIIATESPFYVKFNTPMNKNKFHRYLECDASFYIRPLTYKNKQGKEVEDLSCYVFTPKEALEVNRRYILSFRKGMPAQSGALLEINHSVTLQTGTKPIISHTYPSHESKWIGLYPCFKVETETPVVGGTLEINGEKISGKLQSPYMLTFFTDKVLDPHTTYTASFQVEAVTGEKSKRCTLHFTTVDLEDNRIWLEVQVNENPKVKVYKGTKVIKTMPCSLGVNEKGTPLGTYYIQSKEDVFTAPDLQEGANFWLRFTDTCGFQGLIRDNYWHIKNHAPNQLGYTQTSGNILLNDEDARWLYENVPFKAMVILHK